MITMDIKLRMKLYKAKENGEPGWDKINSPNLCPARGLSPPELFRQLTFVLEKEELWDKTFSIGKKLRIELTKPIFQKSEVK